MGLLHAVKKFFATPTLVTRLEELEAGRAIVEGDVRASSGEPLLSPLKAQPCVAFFYVATHDVSGRAGRQVRPLRSAERFRAFALELEGGRIEVTPRTPGNFGPSDHQTLANGGYPGFRAVEEIVSPRARVRLHGIVRREGDGWVMTYHRIVVLHAGKGGAKAGDKRKRKR